MNSPFVAKLFMEDLETRAINSATHPPSCKVEESTQSLQHINSIDTHILQTQGAPFLFLTLAFIRARKHFAHYSLQKTYPHRPVLTLGQPPQLAC